MARAAGLLAEEDDGGVTRAAGENSAGFAHGLLDRGEEAAEELGHGTGRGLLGVRGVARKVADEDRGLDLVSLATDPAGPERGEGPERPTAAQTREHEAGGEKAQGSARGGQYPARSA